MVRFSACRYFATHFNLCNQVNSRRRIFVRAQRIIHERCYYTTYEHVEQFTVDENFEPSTQLGRFGICGQGVWRDGRILARVQLFYYMEQL